MQGSALPDSTAVHASAAPRRRRVDLFPYFLVAPAVIMVLLVVVYPALYALNISTYSMNLLRPARTEFVGLGNYLEALSDPIFLGAIVTTIRWVAVIATLQMLVAVPTAVFLNTKFRGRGMVRTTILVPWVTPLAVVAIIFVYMTDANFGVINDILVKLGLIPAYQSWIGRPFESFIVLVIAMVWTGFPFVAVMLLAALQAIPDDLYEAARVDGAGGMQRFWHITLPMLMPTVLLILLLRTIWLSHHVDLIYLVTVGGPGYANYTIAVYSFLQTYVQNELGYPSAMAVMLAIVLLVLSAIYIRFIERSREFLR